MKLREALERIHQPRPAGAERSVYLLACSSTATHLQTFLEASLLERHPGRDVRVDPSLYGDLFGSLERLEPQGYAGIAVAAEWYDLDPRLGFRRLGGWAPSQFEDILSSVRAALSRLRTTLERIARSVPVALSLPTLAPPPLEISAPAQALAIETGLASAVAEFAAACLEIPGLRVVSRTELDRLSPAAERFDLRAELGQGMPYRLAHSQALAGLFCALLAPPAPLKGLITDLDDVLWNGLVGEAGAEGIGFTLDAGAQIHGLYQQFLQSLAERGVLIGIASKNDAAAAEQALARPDLPIRRDSFFPVEIHWEPKSASIRRILAAWNIGQDSVAFIDDSPLELAEVQAQFPQIRCLAFPKNDPAQFLPFLATLREWFGKPVIREEDRLRARSLQREPLPHLDAAEPASQDAFLSTLNAVLTFRLSNDSADERAFELLNKTNQFNLNGRRLDESSWRSILRDERNFLLTVSYADKFGPLGKIAVVVGTRNARAARVTSWVMSCRAFSRRIEHATLQYLFDCLDAEHISLDFQPTPRNGPVREFLASLDVAGSSISRADFQSRCPQLPHRIEGELQTHA